MAPTQSFGYDGDGGLGDRLLEAVLRGEKTASSSLAVGYLSGETLPRVGGRWDLIDQAGQRRGTVETVRVRIIPLNEVGDDVAHDEGEGFADAAAWRRAHEAFWEPLVETIPLEAGDPAWTLREAEPVVVEWFRVVPADGSPERQRPGA